MDLSFQSVLVDGSLSSPGVWLSMLISAVLLGGVGIVFIRFAVLRTAPPVVRRLFWLPLLPFLLVCLTATNRVSFAFVFLGAPWRVGLCLMPTLHPVRDLVPFFVGSLCGVMYGRRRLAAFAAA